MKMCPFFLLTFILSIILLLVEITAAVISVTFNPAIVEKLHEGKTQLVKFTIKSNPIGSDQLVGHYQFHVDRPDVADVISQKVFKINDNDLTHNGTQYDGSFQVKGYFLGYSRIEVQKKKDEKLFKDNSENSIFTLLSESQAFKNNTQLLVSVIRDKDIMQKIFIFSVATVVSISYINMGCAIDTNEIYQCLRRPVAPAIGFFSQFFCMPLVRHANFY